MLLQVRKKERLKFDIGFSCSGIITSIQAKYLTIEWKPIIKILTLYYLFILFISCKENFSQSLAQKEDRCTNYISNMDVFWGKSGNIDNILMRFKISKAKSNEYYYYLKYENRDHFLYYTHKDQYFDLYFNQNIFKARSIKVDIPEVNGSYYKITLDDMNRVLNNIIVTGAIVAQDVNGNIINEYRFCRNSIINIDQSKKNEFLKDGLIDFTPEYKNFKDRAPAK